MIPELCGLSKSHHSQLDDPEAAVALWARLFAPLAVVAAEGRTIGHMGSTAMLVS